MIPGDFIDTDFLQDTFDAIDASLNNQKADLYSQETGTITYLGSGIARVEGLTNIETEEVLSLGRDTYGMVFNADIKETGVVVLDDPLGLEAGDRVVKTGRLLDVPVGDSLLGRVMDARGNALDSKGPLNTGKRMPVERPAPPIMDRLPVTVPLQTGIKVIDALIPIGRGQRELIIGDRQTGKTAIAVDTIINQKHSNVICIYCAIGKRGSDIAGVTAALEENGCMDYSIVMAATEEDPSGLQFITPYAAMSVGEYFMENGRDVLVVLDDLTRHARAYREMSLLLRRPPGREAFPGDIFYVHSRLLERSTHLSEEKGGGSLSALPVIETEAQNMSAYIPTNLISITDGQIYLDPGLFQKGILPAVDVGRSVSRVGGKTQLKAYRAVAGDLRLAYSQFEELENFARFGTQLDDETKQTLNRGRRVREIFKQPRYSPLSVIEQIAALVAVNEGLFDDFDEKEVSEKETKIRAEIRSGLGNLVEKIENNEEIEDSDISRIKDTADKALGKNSDGNH